MRPSTNRVDHPRTGRPPLVRALGDYVQLGLDIGRAQALYTLGVSYHQLGRIDQACTRITEAAEIFRAHDDRIGAAYVRCAVAAVQHRDCGRYLDALAVAKSALTLAHEVGHGYLEADTATVLASILLLLGEDDEAEQRLHQALDFARRTGARGLQPAALLGLAACTHTPLGQALAYAGEALDIATGAGLRIQEGNAHIALAELDRHGHGNARARAVAVAHARRGMAVHREIGHRLGEARALHILSALLDDADDFPAARSSRAELAALLKTIGTPPSHFDRRSPDPKSA